MPDDLAPYKWGAGAGAATFVASGFASGTEPGLGGYGIFAGWALLCVIAAARRDLAIWIGLCIVPLCLVASTWPSTLAMAEDPFGIKWATLMLFSGMCLVAGMTCSLALLGPYGRRPAPLWTKG